MSSVSPYMFLVVTLLIGPAALGAQGGGYGSGGMGSMRRYEPEAPRLPGVELEGPLDSGTARVLLTLSEDQARRYTQAYDSFMTATQPQRDSAAAATAKMNERLETGDRPAAMFYVERLQDLGKYLKDRQDKFEDNLKKFLSSDQMKAYHKWRDSEQQAIERKQREDAVRWQEAAFGGFGGARMGGGGTPEIKTPVPPAPGVAAPALGAQAVSVGRGLYIGGQLGTDSTGSLVGSDLRTQAAQAFANLAAVLKAAGSMPRDVVTLTIYVVNYHPADTATIRDAGAAYFSNNPPVTTILGVQSLVREGALISVAATASTRGVTYRPPSQQR
ncbi:MAG TPA: RidA family protein [Gemmatimonadales bacterium]|nr:RidA family protein [Gemmatimonadales bacterium]